jgi:colicin import membrane protein
MDFYRKHKRGIIGTLIFHVVILILLIFMGFFTRLPLPEEEGILVNFGTSNQGLGAIEPRPQQRQQETPPPQRQVEEQVTTPPPQQTRVTPPPAQPQQAREEAMTQDFEEAAAIQAAEKKRKEETERQQQIDEQRRRQEQAEKQKLAEAEKQRQAEIEKQRLAQLEKQRQEEAEKKKREEEQRRIAEINSRAQGAFGGGTSDGGQGTADSRSQGATFPGGNQGVRTGDPNAGAYGAGGSGSGNQGAGISYDLSGRSATSLPKPVYPGDDQGIVVVKVTVDKNGNVTAAEAGARGTTIMDQRFWAEARAAALKAKFNNAPNAAAFQQGTISYRFRLD